jgi:cytochrome P450 family 6
LTLEAEEWRERRTKLSPIFSSGKIKMMFDIVESVADRLVKKIESESEGKNETELRNLCQRFTADSIGNTAFGLECNCELKIYGNFNLINFSFF